MPPQQRLPLDELWPSPRQYFHPFVLLSSSSSSSAPSPSPQSFTPELPPQVITTNRDRSPKKKEPKNSNSNRSNTNKHGSNSNSSSSSRKRNRNCLSRADSERDRRQALRDSIIKLKELLPVSSRSTTVQMDKCTVLKEACKHILDLKAEVQALVKKKEELIISSAKAVQLRCNGSESVRVEEAKMSSIADCQKEDTVECSKRGAMFQEVVCNASNVFVTLQVPEGGGVRLSKVLGAIEKANVNIINAVASWTEGDRSFCLLAHGKAQIASSSSIQALKEDLCALSFSS